VRLSTCPHPGCGEITSSGRCRKHAIERREAIADDRERREPWRYLYGLRIWKEAREAARRQAGYRCERCGALEELAGARALDVHHEEKLGELWRRYHGGTPAFAQAAFEIAATALEGLRVLCDPCHAQAELER
jgi:hypothetical protein